MRTLAINQPYFFPYIGYFQLIHASDKFISLEDVSYINRGWINRNRILINSSASYVTIPIDSASQNRKINETLTFPDNSWKDHLLKKLRISYSRAPFYSVCYKLVRNSLDQGTRLISDIALQSILEVCNYIGLRRQFSKSKGFEELRGEDRIIQLCKAESADAYVNLPGGREIYHKQKFMQEGLDLRFIEPEITEYKQFSGNFIPGLSIIDVIMFNPPEKILEMTERYRLT